MPAQYMSAKYSKLADDDTGVYTSSLSPSYLGLCFNFFLSLEHHLIVNCWCSLL